MDNAEFVDDQPANTMEVEAREQGTTENEPPQKKVKVDEGSAASTEPLGRSIDDYKTLSALQKRRGEILKHCEDSKFTIDGASLDTQEEYFALVKKENGLKKVTAEYINKLKGVGGFSEKDAQIWTSSVLANDMDLGLQEQICTFAGASNLYATRNEEEFARVKKRNLELEAQFAAQKATSPNNNNGQRKMGTSNNNNNSMASQQQPLGKNMKPVDSFYSSLAPREDYGRRHEVGSYKDAWGDLSDRISRYTQK
jgi:hypothetical protein